MKRIQNKMISLFLCFTVLSGLAQSSEKESAASSTTESEDKNITYFDTTTKTIHVFVALCDNKYQGIVPVPAKIGNGQDPNSNLYWGCAFGIRTYFKKSKEWKLIRTEKIDSTKLERLVFKHVSQNYYLVADAYNGQFIKHCTTEFLKSSAGQHKDTVHVNNITIGIAGNSKLVAYVGHDGLMDFDLTENFQNADHVRRDVIILACYSKRYYSSHLRAANIYPLLWTSGLMCPEAYTIHDAITGYLNNETNEQIRTRAALAYSKYQKCSVKAARNLLLTEW